jgi:N-acetylglutamate synthase-like GNAT family acetyltransferase
MISQDAYISIIPFRPEYTDSVINLIIYIQQDEFDLPITAQDQPDLHDIPNYYQTGKGNFWIALHQQTVVGSIALLDIGHGKAALRKMFVHKAFRGSVYGTAKHLLMTLIDWAKTHQIEEIYLGTTAKFLAAHRFYKKNGFSEIAKSELPAQFSIMHVDTKFYRYVLSEVAKVEIDGRV